VNTANHFTELLS